MVDTGNDRLWPLTGIAILATPCRPSGAEMIKCGWVGQVAFWPEGDMLIAVAFMKTVLNRVAPLQSAANEQQGNDIGNDASQNEERKPAAGL